jgi:methyltransferase (TIGR00027 family)
MTRTDDDTWGPDSGVGMTATFGAAARALATNRGLINDPFAEPLVRAAGVQDFTRMVDDQRYADDGGDNATMSGLVTLLGVHTRFLDEFLAAAGRAGIRQVVMLASGLDTRPYRLWWPPGTTVYEIDQPDVIDFKTAVLRGLGAELNAHRRAVGVDLRRDWLTALRRVGFDATQPTVWIAETLLIGFLPPDRQSRLLDGVTAVSAPGSRFAGDHLATASSSLPEAGQTFVDTWRQFGVDVELGGLTYPGEFGAVPQHLADHGWETVERSATDLFTAIGMGALLRGTPPDDGITPQYVTATRSDGPSAAPGWNASA